MGFLSNLVKRRSEIGRPGPSIGVRPMLREPTLDIRGERSIFGQPSPFGPPIPPQPPQTHPTPVSYTHLTLPTKRIV